MNIKTFAAMISRAGDSPVKIAIAADEMNEYRIISLYDTENPYHVTAFGNWKIDKITAVDENHFELIIKTTYEIVKED